MKKYMAYNRSFGPEEGAALVFANTAQEARKLIYKHNDRPYCPDFDNFLDVAANLIRGHEYLNRLKERDEPHIVQPPVCKSCDKWGAGELIAGICTNCREEHTEVLK